MFFLEATDIAPCGNFFDLGQWTVRKSPNPLNIFGGISVKKMYRYSLDSSDGFGSGLAPTRPDPAHHYLTVTNLILIFKYILLELEIVT